MTRIHSCLLALCLAACSHDEDGPVATVSEQIPTVVTLSWTSAQEGLGRVDYGLDGDLTLSTPDEREATREHRITVYGLKAGHTYTFRGVSTPEGGEAERSETVEVELDPPPRALPTLTVSEEDSGAMSPGGYVLVAMVEAGGAWMVILDRDGDYVWTRQVEDGLVTPGGHFDPNTNSITYLPADNSGGTDLAYVQRVSLDGEEQSTTRAYLGHHEGLRHEDGTLAWLAFDLTEAEVDGAEEEILSDMILEGPEGASEDAMPDIRFVLLDHIEPFVPCEHYYDELVGTEARDFSHANSLLYDEDRDEYWMLSRNLDEILITERATGQLVARIGGKDPEIATENPDDMWSHGHMSHRWDGGFMMFDNGFHHDDQRSRIVEYAFDREAGTLEKVWEWSDPSGLFNQVFGDAQKLPDTWLSTWSAYGRIEEVSADGKIVWMAESEIGWAFGRAVWVEDLYDLSTVYTF